MGYKIVQFYKGPLGPEIKLRFYDYENETILFPPTFPHFHLSFDSGFGNRRGQRGRGHSGRGRRQR